MLDIGTVKKQARRLKEKLEDLGFKLGLTLAQELVAVVHGYRNYNTLRGDLALPPKPTPTPSGHTTADPVHLGRGSRVSVNGDGAIAQYLFTTFASPNHDLNAWLVGLPSRVGSWRRVKSKAEVTCFEKGRGKTAVTLALASFDDNVRVVNVVPRLDGPLNPIPLSMANDLEADFVAALKPMLPDGFRVTQKPRWRHLRDVISNRAFARFQSHSMNKSTGNSHAMDRKRWLGFVHKVASEGFENTDSNINLVYGALVGEGFAPETIAMMLDDFERHLEMALFCKEEGFE